MWESISGTASHVRCIWTCSEVCMIKSLIKISSSDWTYKPIRITTVIGLWCFAVQQIHATTHCNQTYLTTVHSNSWDCPILSLSQLLPDTLSDLISDTRSALLRDSLWWEADKEEDGNSDQKHCHFNSCFTLFPHVLEYSLYTATTALDWQLDNCICFYSHHYLSHRTHAIS